MKQHQRSQGRHPKARARTQEAGAHDEPALTAAQMRELRRRVRDLENRNRYLLVSVFGPRFALYYNVSDDTYGMNEPAHATLFKRRATATAVRELLSSRAKIVRCRVSGGGKIILKSLPAALRNRSRRSQTRRPTPMPRNSPADS